MHFLSTYTEFNNKKKLWQNPLTLLVDIFTCPGLSGNEWYMLSPDDSFYACNTIFNILQEINTLRPRQNSRHFPDDIFKWIFLNENVWISINISLKFVPRGPINNIPSLVQVMAWRRPGDKPLSEPMMVRLPTHICVTRPKWVYVSVVAVPRNKTSRSRE